MKIKYVVIGAALITSSVVAFSFDQSNQSTEESSVLGSLISKPKYSREMVLGNILKGALENMHLSNKKIDKKFSE